MRLSDAVPTIGCLAEMECLEKGHGDSALTLPGGTGFKELLLLLSVLPMHQRAVRFMLEVRAKCSADPAEQEGLDQKQIEFEVLLAAG